MEVDRQTFCLSGAHGNRARASLGPGADLIWIEVAAKEAEHAQESRAEVDLVSGESTILKLVNQHVVARYTSSPEDGPSESITLDAFLALLDDWWLRVQQSAQATAMELPHTYRRHTMAPLDGPRRAEVEARWHHLIAGAAAREHTSKWAKRWVESIRSVDAELPVMSALQTLHDYDLTYDQTSPNLVMQGGKTNDRLYCHHDDLIVSELSRWLSTLAEFDADPDGITVIEWVALKR
jgi:hypothetical protein